MGRKRNQKHALSMRRKANDALASQLQSQASQALAQAGLLGASPVRADAQPASSSIQKAAALVADQAAGPADGTAGPSARDVSSNTNRGRRPTTDGPTPDLSSTLALASGLQGSTADTGATDATRAADGPPPTILDTQNALAEAQANLVAQFGSDVNGLSSERKKLLASSLILQHALAAVPADSPAAAGIQRQLSAEVSDLQSRSRRLASDSKAATAEETLELEQDLTRVLARATEMLTNPALTPLARAEGEAWENRVGEWLTHGVGAPSRAGRAKDKDRSLDRFRHRDLKARVRTLLEGMQNPADGSLPTSLLRALDSAGRAGPRGKPAEDRELRAAVNDAIAAAVAQQQQTRPSRSRAEASALARANGVARTPKEILVDGIAAFRSAARTAEGGGALALGDQQAQLEGLFRSGRVVTASVRDALTQAQQRVQGSNDILADHLGRLVEALPDRSLGEHARAQLSEAARGVAALQLRGLPAAPAALDDPTPSQTRDAAVRQWTAALAQAAPEAARAADEAGAQAIAALLDAAVEAELAMDRHPPHTQRQLDRGIPPLEAATRELNSLLQGSDALRPLRHRLVDQHHLHGITAGDVMSIAREARRTLLADQVGSPRTSADTQTALDQLRLLQHDLAGLVREGLPSRLLDNPYGRAFDTTFAAALYDRPPQATRDAIGAVNRELATVLRELQQDSRSDALAVASEVLDRFESGEDGVARAWMTPSSKVGAILQRRAVATGRGRDSREDTLNSLVAFLDAPPQTGEDLAGSVWLYNKLSLALTGAQGRREAEAIQRVKDEASALSDEQQRGDLIKAADTASWSRLLGMAADATLPTQLREALQLLADRGSQALAPWFDDATASYDEIGDRQSRTNRRTAEGEQALSLGHNADLGAQAVAPVVSHPFQVDGRRTRAAGVTLAHQRTARSIPHETRRPVSYNVPASHRLHSQAQRALAAGQTFAAGVSGSTHGNLHLLKWARDRATSRGEAPPDSAAFLVGNQIFMTYDGGHSLNEVMWVANNLNQDLGLGLALAPPGVERDAWVASVDTLVANTDGPLRSALEEARREAMTDVLDRFDSDSIYADDRNPGPLPLPPTSPAATGGADAPPV